MRKWGNDCSFKSLFCDLHQTMRLRNTTTDEINKISEEIRIQFHFLVISSSQMTTLYISGKYALSSAVAIMYFVVPSINTLFLIICNIKFKYKQIP